LGCKKEWTTSTNEILIKINKNSSATFAYKGKTCKVTLAEAKGNTVNFVFENGSMRQKYLLKNC
jgi:hypothetical protein